MKHQALLRQLGCTVHCLPAAEGFPDGVFVEDPAVVLDEVAIILRSGARSRRGEASSIATAVEKFRPIRRIEEPGEIDGGDILVFGRIVYIGETSRSNAAAIEQMRAIVEPLGYQVRPVPVRGALHLKSAVTAVADDLLLLNPEMVPSNSFEPTECVAVDPTEPHAANALRVGATVVFPSAYPKTAALLKARGLILETVDASELAKAEGALTCCSLLFEDTRAAPGQARFTQ